MTYKNIFELMPRFDSRASFYGKAHILEAEDGVLYLQSYNTIVSECRDGQVKHYGKWSATTSRHQREFERQFNKTV